MKYSALLFALLLAACDDPEAPEVFDVSGAWLVSGTSPSPACGFTADLTIQGTTASFTGTALLTFAGRTETVVATLARDELEMNGLELVVEQREAAALRGRYPCQNQQGTWSMARKP